MACMQDKEEQAICPHCGFDAESSPNPLPALPLGAVLQKKYLVGKMLFSDSEGFTYVVFDCIQKNKALLREYYPTPEVVSREGENGSVQPLNGKEEIFQKYLHDFLMNARCVARMRDLSGILSIYDIFTENGTAYYVMEDYDGCTLREYVQKNSGPVTWNAARPLFMPLLSTLNTMHEAGIYHFGISPDTLIVTKSGKMKLMGFRIAAVRREETELPATLVPGCAAIEQYRPVGACGPYTDVYAFAACLFFTLTSRLPNDAPHRQADGRLLIPTSILKQIPKHVTSAMANALQVAPNKRTQSFERLRAELVVAATVAIEQDGFSKAEPQKMKPSEEEPKIKKRKPLPDFVVGILSGVVALLVFGLAGLAYLSLTGNKANDPDAGTNVSSEAVSGITSGDTSGSVSSIPSNMVPAPPLTGMTLEEAKQSTSLKIYVTEYAFSDEVEEGKIISQSIAQGEPVAEEGIITVVLSQGAEYRTLPSVSGKDVVQAKTDLIAAGFTIGSTESEPSTTAAAGTVLRVNGLTEGQQYQYGTAVNLVIASSAS